MRINEGRETFHKDLARASAFLAKTFTDLKEEADRLSSAGQVSHATGIAAMYPLSYYTTQRTSRGRLRRGNRYHKQVSHLLKSNEFQPFWQRQDRLRFHFSDLSSEKALYPEEAYSDP